MIVVERGSKKVQTHSQGRLLRYYVVSNIKLLCISDSLSLSGMQIFFNAMLMLRASYLKFRSSWDLVLVELVSCILCLTKNDQVAPESNIACVVYSPAMTDFIFMVDTTSYMFVTGEFAFKSADIPFDHMKCSHKM